MDIDFEEEIVKVETELARCKKEREKLNSEIGEMTIKSAELPRQLSYALSRVKTQLALAESDTSQLSSMLSLTCVLADNISGKVRDLDTAKCRVVDCLQRVEDILDLRFCTDGVQSSLQNEDYEQAAGLIHRFLALDTATLGPFMERPEDSGNQKQNQEEEIETLKNCCETLKRAERELKGIIREKFDESVRSGDIASMERFFKLFPLLNEHEEGMLKFASYLRAKVADAADKNYSVMLSGGQDDTRANVLYADSLTLLFEGIARIIEVHQPLVETYYGAERLFPLLQTLQLECDIQAKRIINKFLENRQFKTLCSRVEHWAKNETSSLSGGASSGRGQQNQGPEKPEPLKLDTVLSEVTLMNTRAELYLRFLRRRLLGALDMIFPQADQVKDKAHAPKKPADRLKQIEKFLNSCELNRQMQELIGSYISMEEYFMKECVLKAIKGARGGGTAGGGEGGLFASSCVEDVVFIVRKSIRRSLTSSNVDCVCAMLNYAGQILEKDYFSALYGKLKSGYPSEGSFAEAFATAAAYTSVIQQGKMPTASTGDAAQRARVEFLTALNDMEASGGSIKELKEALEQDTHKHLGAQAAAEPGKSKLESCLSSFSDVVLRFCNAVRYGMEQLAIAVIKPRVKAWTEAFGNYTHAPTESEFGDFEANEPFIAEYLSNLDSLLASFKEVLSESNYEQFIVEVSEEVCRRLEKAIFKATFNSLGGLQLDKEVRELISYMSSITSWTLREKFTRLTQIATLLNVEDVKEIKDMWNSNNITWRLTPSEVRQFLALRIDLSGEEIRRLKL